LDIFLKNVPKSNLTLTCREAEKNVKKKLEKQE